MAKFDVTPVLAESIKSLRIQKHVTSKSISEHIGKSPSYLSKLERGDIKTIDESELTAIFKYIYYGNAETDEHFDPILKELYDSYILRYTDDEIKDQIWLDNYDTVLRLIPVPVELIDDINRRISLLNVSTEQLCNRINANEGIRPEVENADGYPFNEWQAYVVEHQILFRFIKMRTDVSSIDNLLSKRVEVSNYVTMLSLVYYIMKYERFGTLVEITNEQNDALMKEATDYLNSYKFFSLYELNSLKEKARSEAERTALLSSFDKENISLINEVLQAYRAVSEINISRVNTYLSAYVKNMKWDLGFMMNIISLPFYTVDDSSYGLRKSLLTEIEGIIKNYSEVPDEKKRIELYE